jgi:hypothetical protein
MESSYKEVLREALKRVEAGQVWRKELDGRHQMQYHQMMRTTLDIDADILLASKELAARQGSTAGKVLSDLARRALTGEVVSAAKGLNNSELEVREPVSTYGFKPFPKRGVVVTNELVNQLRDEEGI